jgi:quercetin dioxygenase-like cupin family protein
MVFMHFTRDADIAEHSHGAQWGVVLAGEMELTVAGQPRLLRKGDNYVLPEGVRHGAKIRAGYSDVTLFDEPARYRKK